MSPGENHERLLLLLNWMAPTFPIGGFAYSHGLEQAISDGRVGDAMQLEAWVAALLRHGSGWNDAVLFAQCWEADTSSLNEWALALAGCAERFKETTDLGRNFEIAAAVWRGESPHAAAVAYPVAAGLACCRAGIDKTQAMTAFLQNFCATLVSVAVRLVPLGQTAGLVVLRNLSPVIYAVAQRAVMANLDDLGSCSVAADISAMKHETLETRIFRT